jgi:hypothetical protein
MPQDIEKSIPRSESQSSHPPRRSFKHVTELLQGEVDTKMCTSVMVYACFLTGFTSAVSFTVSLTVGWERTSTYIRSLHRHVISGQYTHAEGGVQADLPRMRQVWFPNVSHHDSFKALSSPPFAYVQGQRRTIGCRFGTNIPARSDTRFPYAG